MSEVVVVDSRVGVWREQFEDVLDAGATDYEAVLDVELGENLPGLRRELRAVYRRRSNVNGILVRMDHLDVGIATRASADRDAGTAGEAATVDPGSSDGATLPGRPGEYRPVVFACAGTGCAAKSLASFYDERTAPRCPEHGRMAVNLAAMP
ncbi:hypothetical protein [Dactylosporangium sp. NPDC051541]|uniref:hypothetical protein n=1 Tax=Dactylosporangium sp. NPDC051541 TaxID=3363977 RepID=UPI0037A3CA4C